MNELLGILCMILFGLSILSFITGFIMLFIESKKKLGLKLLIASGIVFVIGFGTCVGIVFNS
jgi:hypothetical protein